MPVLRGRIPIVDPDNPIAWAKDDITGLPVMHDELVPVMQYAGTNIIWTGFMTHKDKLDIPQPQLAPARLRPDPVPIENIRPFMMPTTPPIPTGLTVVQGFDPTSVICTWDSVSVATSYVLTWANTVAVNPIPGIAITTTPTVSYTITNLAVGTYYLIAIASVYSEATSANSDPVAITPTL